VVNFTLKAALLSGKNPVPAEQEAVWEHSKSGLLGKYIFADVIRNLDCPNGSLELILISKIPQYTSHVIDPGVQCRMVTLASSHVNRL
jgi:hypothetical protein